MKNNVFIPSTCPGMHWASQPISFPNNFTHTSLYRGLIHICRYSIISPVSPSNSAPAISHNNFIGNFRDANCIGVAGVSVSSINESITPWVSVLLLSLVFFSGVFPSIFEILFGFGCGSICCNYGDVTTISFYPTGSLRGSLLYGGEWHGGCVHVTLCGVAVSSLTLCGGRASFLLSF